MTSQSLRRELSPLKTVRIGSNTIKRPLIKFLTWCNFRSRSIQVSGEGSTCRGARRSARKLVGALSSPSVPVMPSSQPE
jgi:hypothetical protein